MSTEKTINEAEGNAVLPLVSKKNGTVCPSCENQYPRLFYDCEECGCTWRAN